MEEVLVAESIGDNPFLAVAHAVGAGRNIQVAEGGLRFLPAFFLTAVCLKDAPVADIDWRFVDVHARRSFLYRRGHPRPMSARYQMRQTATKARMRTRWIDPAVLMVRSPFAKAGEIIRILCKPATLPHRPGRVADSDQ